MTIRDGFVKKWLHTSPILQGTVSKIFILLYILYLKEDWIHWLFFAIEHISEMAICKENWLPIHHFHTHTFTSCAGIYLKKKRVRSLDMAPNSNIVPHPSNSESNNREHYFVQIFLHTWCYRLPKDPSSSK